MKNRILFYSFLIVFLFAANYSFSAEVVEPLKNRQMEVFADEKAMLGLKDEQGNIVLVPTFKKMIMLGENSWLVQKKNKFGILDTSGKYLVEPKYRHAERLFGKYAKLGNEKDYGLYDEYGNTIIAPEYTKIDPLYGKMFLTCKKYKYGISDISGKILLENKFDDIYMPTPKSLRIKHEGEWYEIERWQAGNFEVAENVTKVTINEQDFKVTHLINNTGVWSGYSALTFSDYFIKIFSSISPAYEDTIDELMLSHGTDTVTIFMKFSWLPKFPFTYAKKYYNNFITPNNGPLSDVRADVKKQLK